MVKVHIYKDNKGNVVKYILSGHARYSKLPKFFEYLARLFLIKEHTGYPEAGKDVVCAAVSSVAQAAVVGLKEVLGLHVGLKIEDGYLECVLPDDITEEEKERAGIILKTMVIALKNIEMQYKNLLYVIEMEV